MDKYISIIIPCYNVEPYIDRCMESLVKQTIGIENLELICVEDASQDLTWEKLLGWEKQYPDSVILIKNDQNLGPGEARNIGMRHASAPYIGFVDSDDWVSVTMFEKMYEKAKGYDCDIVMTLSKRDFQEVDFGHRIGEDQYWIFTTEKDRRILLREGLSFSVCEKIYNREWIHSLNLDFPKDLNYEDAYWTPLLLLYVKKVYVLKEVLYCYYANSNSIILKRNDVKKLDFLKIECMKLEEYKNRGVYDKYQKEIEYNFLKYYFTQTLHYLFTSWDSVPIDIYDQMKSCVIHTFPNYKENKFLQLYLEENATRGLLVASLDYEMTQDKWNELKKEYLQLSLENPSYRIINGKGNKMNQDIPIIFNKNKVLLRLLDQVIYYFRVQNYDRALRLSNSFLANLTPFMEMLFANLDYFNRESEWIQVDSFNGILSNLLKVQEERDWILLADLYETQVVSFLLSIQEKIVYSEEILWDDEKRNRTISLISEKNWGLGETLKESVNPIELLDRGYLVEYTAGGDYTVGVVQGNQKKYFHSNNRVWKEAFLLASSWYREEKNEYIVYGLGFGYHIADLYELDENVSVEVYESDMNIINLACAFSVLEWLLKRPRFQLFYDPKFKRLQRRIRDMDDNAEFVIHYPSLLNVKQTEMKERLENYFIRYSSTRDQIRRMNGNFIENVKHRHPAVDELEEKLKDKDLYIIAAGPSLDKNIMRLKEVSGQGVIMATGTVFRKLMKEGIKPDYFIITESAPRVYVQIEGYEDSDVPMIYLSTAYQKFAKNYKGEKYIVFQNEYALSEEEAEKRGCRLYDTGGSVSTLALDIGIRMRCKRILFLGLDLSYPDNLVHAKGTSRRILKDTSGLRQVKDISGKTIYTNKAMDMYRGWMERRIKDVKETEIINATEGGVFIKGMRHERLCDVIR